MSDIAGIAGNAVAAYQNALSTVSNNIANVATDGYSRQDVTLQALPVTKAGSIFLGTGVIVDSVKRQYDAFVESNLRNTTSDLASQAPMVNYANRVVDVMGGPTMGLNTALDQFFSSARALSADTSSTVLRSSFVRDADGVAQRFGQLSGQLELIQNETQDSVDSIVNQMNTLTKQLAVVNGLRDIHAQLGTGDYWRLRLGVGHPGVKSEVVHWVLKKPTLDHRIAIDQCIDRALAALPALLAGDMNKAMLLIHTSKPPRPKLPKPEALPGPTKETTEPPLAP